MNTPTFRQLIGYCIAAGLLFLSACSQPAYIQQNDLLVANGRLDDAISDYQRLIAEDPEESELHYQLAKVQYIKGNYTAAAGAIEKAIIIEHLSDRYQLLAGKISFAANDYFKAISHLTNALTMNPQYLEAYFYLGLAHQQTGQTVKALEQLQSAISIEPLYFKAHLAWAEIRFLQLTQGSAGGAAESASNKTSASTSNQSESTLKAFLLLTESLEKALAIKPDSVRGHLLLSKIYNTLGAEYKARSILEKWLIEFGRDDRILLALADIEYRSGRFEKALNVLAGQAEPSLDARVLKLKLILRTRPDRSTEKEIEQLLRQHPDSEELFLLAGYWKLQQGDISRAEREVQKSLEINPGFAEAYLALSRIHEAQNDNVGSRWALRKALQLAPANLEIRLSYVHALIEQGNWYEAENYLKQVALDNDHPQVIYLRGLIAMEKGDSNLAEKLFRDAASKQYSVNTEIRLAELELRQGQIRSAESRLQRISQFFPENLDIALTRASLLEQTDRSREIPQLLKPYLDNRLGRGRVHLLLAESLVQRGQTEAALETLNRAILKWPRNPDLVQAYTFYLGISNQHGKAIPLLEEMQTFDHKFSQLFYFRLRAFYFMAGKKEKFKTYNRQFQLERNRVRRRN